MYGNPRAVRREGRRGEAPEGLTCPASSWCDNHKDISNNHLCSHQRVSATTTSTATSSFLAEAIALTIEASTRAFSAATLRIEPNRSFSKLSRFNFGKHFTKHINHSVTFNIRNKIAIHASCKCSAVYFVPE